MIDEAEASGPPSIVKRWLFAGMQAGTLYEYCVLGTIAIFSIVLPKVLGSGKAFLALVVSVPILVWIVSDGSVFPVDWKVAGMGLGACVVACWA